MAKVKKESKSENQVEVLINQKGESTDLVFSNIDGEIKKYSKEEKERDEIRLVEIDKIDDAVIKNAKIATTQYWEATDKGDSIRGIFKGFKILSVKDKQDPSLTRPLAAIVIKTSKATYLAAGVTIVEPFVNGEIGKDQAVHITYEGKQGDVKYFTVKKLEV